MDLQSPSPWTLVMSTIFGSSKIRTALKGKSERRTLKFPKIFRLKIIPFEKFPSERFPVRPKFFRPSVRRLSVRPSSVRRPSPLTKSFKFIVKNMLFENRPSKTHHFLQLCSAVVHPSHAIHNLFFDSSEPSLDFFNTSHAK